MKRKIYISVNLPKKTQKGLSRAMERWEDLPIKWTKPENLHLSLLFLGFVDDDSSLEVCEKIQHLCQNEEMFDVEMDAIRLSPSKDDAKKVVLTGGHSEALKNLVERIEKELGILNSPKKEFHPNILLGKIRKKRWEEMENIPEIEKAFPLLVNVESVDVMASDFEGDDNGFVVVESCPLNA
jgi:2'-5' RNA ligase